MAIERDVILTGRAADGGATIDLPVTRLGNIEHTSGDKETAADADLIPLMDSAAAKEMKKITFAKLIEAAKGRLNGVYAAVSHRHTVAQVDGLGTQLSNKADGPWRFYRDLSEIGITADQETIEAVANALPDRSEISYVVNTTRDIYPMKYGLCTVRRPVGHRVSVWFHEPRSGLCWTGKLYLPDTPAWNGWLLLAAAAPPAWHGLTPAGGYSAGTGGLRYCKDSGGIVYLTGSIMKGSRPLPGEAFMTMPAGFRPAANISFVAAQLSGAAEAAWCTVCVVQPDGTVRFYGGNPPTDFGASKDIVFSVTYPAAG